MPSPSAYPPLTVVMVDGEQKAVISAVTFHSAGEGWIAVRYTCEWWNGKSVEQHTFDSDRVRPVGESSRTSIGFIQGNQ